jgi:hypothetical protein
MTLSLEAKQTLKITLAGLLLMFSSYVVFVFIWNVSSDKVKPANFLDLEVKTPVYTKDWLIRRADGL